MFTFVLWGYVIETTNLKLRIMPWLSELVGTREGISIVASGNENVAEMYKTLMTIYFLNGALMVTYNNLHHADVTFIKLWNQMHSTCKNEFIISRLQVWILFAGFPLTIFGLVGPVCQRLLTSFGEFRRKVGLLVALYASVIMPFGFINNTMIHVLSLLYFLAITSRLKHLLQELTDEVKALGANLDLINLEAIHRRHFDLSTMIRMADKHLACYIFVIYASFIPTMCMVLYHYLFLATDICSFLIMTTFIVMIFGTFMIVMLTLATTSTVAMIFMDQLEKPNGYTCLDLFVFSKKSILSILSTFTTYFILYMQLQS
ncbi:uncharacterized protein LOC111629443 isoform X2 [Centruroides sculpturatus]|uniref:uncharacterized protein LOC111629443 isoform X2 n=1 Tax=Centruroides sculpturatus TaxID=218467 RepID=UPI000C6DC0A7|nr:uncharacterized protein LOC111629443 isoform X2 [Centruroides sculpturatus]